MHKLSKIKLIRVQYVPKVLEPGSLYVAEEFGAAVHLCACGCGTKVSTPLGPTEWTLEETLMGPTLNPSVGNWQIPCKSHYWVRNGSIIWSDAWTPEQIIKGRQAEEHRRHAYYDARGHQHGTWLQRLWEWIKSLFR